MLTLTATSVHNNGFNYEYEKPLCTTTNPGKLFDTLIVKIGLDISGEFFSQKLPYRIIYTDVFYMQSCYKMHFSDASFYKYTLVPE